MASAAAITRSRSAASMLIGSLTAADTRRSRSTRPSSSGRPRPAAFVGRDLVVEVRARQFVEGVEGVVGHDQGSVAVLGRSAGSRPVPEGRRELGPAPGDPGLHGAERQVEHVGDLGVVEVGQVTQDHRHPEVLGQCRQRSIDHQSVDDGAVAGCDAARRGASVSPSSVGIGRRRRRRSSSRQALVVTRYNQVVKLERPSKRGRPRTTAISASWVASAASAGLTGDPTGDGADPVVVPAEQGVERRPIARLGRRDQFGVGSDRPGRVSAAAPDHPGEKVSSAIRPR